MNSPYTNQQRDYTIEPGCPWYDAQQTYGAPNVNWCEPTQCATINEPANTWSNLGFIFIGIILVRKLREAPISWFPLAVVVMGILSGVYHASNNYLTQFLDFVGMYFMMSFLLAFNFNRVFRFFQFKFFTVYWFFVFVNTMIFMIFDILDIPPQQTMLMNVVPIVVFDLMAGISEGSFRRYKYFLLAVVFIGVAQACAIADIQRMYCDPSHPWLHGHVLWHILGSVGMLFAGLHMKRVHKGGERMFL